MSSNKAHHAINKMYFALLPYSSEFSTDISMSCQHLVSIASTLSITNQDMRYFLDKACKFSESSTEIPYAIWMLYSDAVIESLIASGRLNEEGI